MTIQNVSNINPSEGNSMHALVSANSERSMDLVSKTVGTMQEQFQEKMTKLKSLEDRVTSLEDARKKAIEHRNQQRQELTQFVQSIQQTIAELHEKGVQFSKEMYEKAIQSINKRKSLHIECEDDYTQINPRIPSIWHMKKREYNELQKIKAMIELNLLKGQPLEGLLENGISLLDIDDLLMLIDIKMDCLRLFELEGPYQKIYPVFQRTLSGRTFARVFWYTTLAHYRNLSQLKLDSERFPAKIQHFKDIDPEQFKTNKREYLSKLLIRETQRMSKRVNPDAQFYAFFVARVTKVAHHGFQKYGIKPEFLKDQRIEALRKDEPYTNAMLLVLMGADLNYQDENGMTPLHHAELMSVCKPRPRLAMGQPSLFLKYVAGKGIVKDNVDRSRRGEGASRFLKYVAGKGIVKDNVDRSRRGEGASRFLKDLGAKWDIKDNLGRTPSEIPWQERVDFYNKVFLPDAAENKDESPNPLWECIPDSLSQEKKDALKQTYDTFFKLGCPERMTDPAFLQRLIFLLKIYHKLNMQIKEHYTSEKPPYFSPYACREPLRIARKFQHKDIPSYQENRRVFLSELLCRYARWNYDPKNPFDYASDYTLNLDKEYPSHASKKLNSYLQIMVLLFMGADINYQDYQGWTPLHYLKHAGGMHSNSGGSTFLMQLGANPDLRNHDGQLPSDLIPAKYCVGDEIYRAHLYSDDMFYTKLGKKQN